MSALNRRGRGAFRWRMTVASFLAASLLAGCAGFRAHSNAQSLAEKGDVVGALDKYREAIRLDPENVEYRQSYYRHREAVVSALVREASAALEAGRYDAAEAAFKRAESIDKGNARVRSGMEQVTAARRHHTALDAAEGLARKGEWSEAILKVRAVLAENANHRRASQLLRQLSRQAADQSGKDLGIYPKLRQTFRKPVSLSFTNATVLQVFDALKQASGLNFVFDRDVRSDARTTFAVSNKPVEDIVRLILATNQLDRRVLDEDTLLIYPNTPQKAAEYRELVVRSFYLSNADINKTAALLRTMVKVKDVFVDEKLNLLMIRDSEEVVRLAERLIANQDLAEPEVMLELEVLEVAANRLTEMGVRWPDSISAGVIGESGRAGELTLREFQNRNSDLVRLQFNDPLIAAQLRAQNGEANLLANPRIRVRNRQVAKVLIGERVPVITTTSTANVGTSESVNYLDVGLKLEIEPTVSLDEEVSMRVALEVSNILETITRTSGTQAYRLGTRNASTTLRVRDNETQVLAGLIQRDERRSNVGLPGLNEIPIANRLFGANTSSDTKTEIVLLITPRIVRNIDVPGPGQIEMMSGTEAALGAGPIQLGPSRGEAGRPNTAAGTGVPPPIPGVGPRPSGPPGLPSSATPPAPLQPPSPPPFPPQAPQPLTPGVVPPALSPPPLVPTGPGAPVNPVTPPGTSKP